MDITISVKELFNIIKIILSLVTIFMGCFILIQWYEDAGDRYISQLILGMLALSIGIFLLFIALGIIVVRWV